VLDIINILEGLLHGGLLCLSPQGVGSNVPKSRQLFDLFKLLNLALYVHLSQDVLLVATITSGVLFDALYSVLVQRLVLLRQ